MRPFLDGNFLPQTTPAQELFNHHAASQTIIDYHCHLSPAEVAEDRGFQSITELWLGSKHYKWCAMRTNGIPERHTETEITHIYNKVYKGHVPTEQEVRQFKSAMLYVFALQDHASGWVQQYHYGALRNNSRMMRQLGPADNEMVTPILINFQDGSVAGKISRFVTSTVAVVDGGFNAFAI